MESEVADKKNLHTKQNNSKFIWFTENYQSIDKELEHVYHHSE